MIVAKHFPKRSIDLAKKKAKEIRKKFKKKNLSQRLKILKNEVFDDFGYGAREAIDSKKVVCWPHELKKQRYCADFAVYSYLVFSYLKLKPHFFDSTGYRVVGSDTSDSRGAGHSFIIFESNNKNYLFDPLMHRHGVVKRKGKTLRVKDGIQDTRIIEFDTMAERNVKSIADKIRYMKTPKGKVEALAGEQMYTRKNNLLESKQLTVSYDMEQNEIKAVGSFRMALGMDKLYEKITQLNEKGKIESQKLDIYLLKNLDWANRTDEDFFGSIDSSWTDEIQAIMTPTETNSQNSHVMYPTALESIIKKNQVTEQVVKQFGLKKGQIKKLKEIKKSIDELAKEQFEEFISCERSTIQIVANRALYQKDSVRGLIFKDNDREEFYLQAMMSFKKLLRQGIINDYIGNIQAGGKNIPKESKILKKKVSPQERRAVDGAFFHSKDLILGFSTLILHRPYEFLKTADMMLYGRQNVGVIQPNFDFGEVNMALKQRGTTLFKGYKAMFFENVANSIHVHKFLETKKAIKKYQEIVKPYLKIK